MSFNQSDEALFAAILRERFPHNADRVMAQTGLPINAMVYPSQLPTAQTTFPYPQAEEMRHPREPLNVSDELDRITSSPEPPPETSVASLSIATASASSSRLDDGSVHEIVNAAQSLRHRLRLTQKAFAARLGISPRTLQDWEQGRRLPSGPAKSLLERGIKELAPGRLI